MTPTHKKYAKHVGEMYWTMIKLWDFNVSDYKTCWNMVMITGLERKYSESGDYVYTIETLKEANPERVSRGQYRQRCHQFLDTVDRPSEWTRIVPVTDENPPS